MAKLTAKQRKALPDSAFAGPNRSYPVEDKGHAKAAKSRASHAEKIGHISKATEAKIDRKADKVLHKGKKGDGHDGHGHIGLPHGEDHAEDHTHKLTHKPAANAEHTRQHHNVVNPHSHHHKLKHG